MPRLFPLLLVPVLACCGKDRPSAPTITEPVRCQSNKAVELLPDGWVVDHDIDYECGDMVLQMFVPADDSVHTFYVTQGVWDRCAIPSHVTGNVCVRYRYP